MKERKKTKERTQCRHSDGTLQCLVPVECSRQWVRTWCYYLVVEQQSVLFCGEKGGKVGRAYPSLLVRHHCVVGLRFVRSCRKQNAIDKQAVDLTH